MNPTFGMVEGDPGLLQFDVDGGDYKEFITNLSKALAYHPYRNSDIEKYSLEDPLGIVHHLLPEQNSGQPERWLYVTLMNSDRTQTTTLAVRGDNVYLHGFKNQEGRWYEFGKEMAPNQCQRQRDATHFLKNSTFLGFSSGYSELVGGPVGWQNLPLGRMSAQNAVSELSKYNGGGKKKLRTHLAKVIVMICEAARMFSYRELVRDQSLCWETEISLTDLQIKYLTKWMNMSRAMLQWAAFTPALKEMGIRGHKEARKVVHLILNSPTGQVVEPEDNKSGGSDDPHDGHLGDGNDYSSQHRYVKGNGHLGPSGESDGKSSHQGSGYGESSHQGEGRGHPRQTNGNENSKLQQNVDHGQSLVEVFTLASVADISFLDSITVFDGRLGQVIFWNEEGAADSEGNFVLSGPYRGISADGRVALKIIPVAQGAPEQEVSIWDPYADGAEHRYDQILTANIPGGLKLTYAVLSSAMEASVQVDVFLFENVNFYGLITAHTQLPNGEEGEATIVLHKSEVDGKVELIASSTGSRVPLTRSVVAWPVHSRMQIDVKCFHPVIPPIDQGTSSSANAVASTTLSFSFEDHTPRVCFQTLDGIGHVRVSVDDTREYRDGPNNSLPRSLRNQVTQNAAMSMEKGLLVVHPGQLTFTIEPNKNVFCLLHLTNRSYDYCVAVRCRPGHEIVKLSSILPPDSTSTYLLRLENPLPPNMDAFSFIVQSCYVPEEEEEDEENVDNIFVERGQVVEVTIPATVCGPPHETINTFETVPDTMLISPVEVTVEVHVFLFGSTPITASIIGDITAHGNFFGEANDRVFFRSRHGDKVKLFPSSDGSAIPLSKNVFQWLVGSPLRISVGTLMFSFEDYTPKVCFQTLDGIGHVRVSVDDTRKNRGKPNNSLPRSLTNEIMQKNKEMFVETRLLVVHPSQLTFTFEPNKIMSCLLHLTNNSHDHQIAFRYHPGHGKTKISGILPRDSTSTYLVRLEESPEPPNISTFSVILDSCVVPEDEEEDDVDNIFDMQPNDEIVEVTLQAIVCFAPDETTTTLEPIQPGIETISDAGEGSPLSEVMQLNISESYRVPRMKNDEDRLQRILDKVENPTNLPLAFLQRITGDFSEERKIGQGGFGEVYKGVFGEQIVAVKRIYINENTVDDRLFLREFAGLMNTNHPNVVRFLGFCSNTHQRQIEDAPSGGPIMANVLERLLCFEYISNGSLDKHITDELRGLDWEARYAIITGICKGLCYLHEDKGIIHMDLKPSNILLHHQDKKYWVPKITDFGLSTSNEKSHTVTRFGTRGYMAPEYVNLGKTTVKSDIYSLGAIIIELVTGCKDVPTKDKVLRRWRHRWGEPLTPLQYEQVTRCIEIAGECRAEIPEVRPSIKEIISYLKKSETTSRQISPFLYEDYMLGIRPLELHRPYDLKEDKLFCVELKNDTGNHMAFNIKLPSPERYSTQPGKGIVLPKSKYEVKITVHPRDTHPGDKLTVQSMKAIEGLRDEDITEHMFEGAGKVFDEVDLIVIYEPTKPQENCKRRGDTNMPAEEVPEAKKRKNGESTSGKGKNKIGSSENAQAASMDNSSSSHGQYMKQLDRHNFYPLESFSQSQATKRAYLARSSDRAIDVTRGAMGSVLHKLGVLHEEFNQQTSVKEDANKLVEMQQALSKLSDVQLADREHDVMLWASSVREMSYNLEDFVDGFLVSRELDSGRSAVRELTHEMNLEKGNSHQPIGDLIKHHISKQVQDAANKFEKYNIQNIPIAPAKADTEDPRISGIYIHREQLSGIETPKEELISLLEEDGDKSMLKIVSIVGFGGLGKTTLAKAVYDHFLSRDCTKGFVPVGQNPDVSEVLKKIIYEFENSFNAANLNVGKLQDKIYKLLESKRYFIVIDDLWNSSVWNAIRPAFPDNKNGSRVMITTRVRDVASLRGDPARKYVYEIKPLSDEDSETLFFTRIFGSKEDCRLTPGKREISKCILKRCGGMPLGINSITCLLDPDAPDATWENVWKSLGDLREGKSPLDNMNQILDLSYIHLPGHLKTCLLYVCMYPEDMEIDKNDLCRQWVAEGMVSTEDVAEDYFNKLINMCLIQPGKIDYYSNEVLSCRVNDIILDLLRSKSAEVNFIQVIDGLKHERGAHGEIRRVSLSVHYNDEDIENMRTLETIRGPLEHVRSVLFYTSSLVPYFLVFKYVRVLRLEDCRFGKDIDLTGMTRLFLLRYLKIVAYRRGLKLPDQIGQLQRLETIDLQGVLLENYPSDIVSLPCLSHLMYDFPDGGIALPDGIDRLKSLRTLVGVCISKSSVESLKGIGELPSLTKLKFDDSWEFARAMHVNALHHSICKLSASLRILHLPGHGGIDVAGWSTSLFPPDSNIRELNLECCDFQSCPQWISKLRNLYSLKIVVREVGKSVSMVSRLPSLAYLSLSREYSYKEDDGREEDYEDDEEDYEDDEEDYEEADGRQEERVVIPGHGTFQALKELIFLCPDVLVTFEEEAMPKLEKLHMLFPFDIDSEFLPVGIEHLTGTLKEIILDRVWGTLPSTESADYNQRSRDHSSRIMTMLYRAFKPHHHAADIVLLIDGHVGYPHLTGKVELIEGVGQDGRTAFPGALPDPSYR